MLKDPVFARNITDGAVEDHEVKVLTEQRVRRLIIEERAVAAVEEPLAIRFALDHQMYRVFYRAVVRRIRIDFVVCSLDMAPRGRFDIFFSAEPIYSRVTVVVAVSVRVDDGVQPRIGEQCRAGKGTYELRQTRPCNLT